MTEQKVVTAGKTAIIFSKLNTLLLLYLINTSLERISVITLYACFKSKYDKEGK